MSKAVTGKFLYLKSLIFLFKAVALLNSENFDEAVEFLQQNSNLSSNNSLTLNEIKKIMNLRADFPRDKIKQLTL